VHCGGCEQKLAAVAEQPLTDTQSQQDHPKSACHDWQQENGEKLPDFNTLLACLLRQQQIY
jgi:hypothetical protein